MGWWGNNATNSHLSSSKFNSRALPCCRSAQTRLIGPAINDAWRTVTGCLRCALADNLPLLAGILSAELCRREARLSLSRRAIEPGHLLQSTECECTASHIETPICARRTTSHQFI